MKVVVAEREFKIFKLEKWWLAFNDQQFAPQGCKHIFGKWYWRR